MAGKKREKPREVNTNWEAEIAAYDETCRLREAEYARHTIVIKESGNAELTEEENAVLTLFLNGVSCNDIAKQFEVEVDLITGLIEIIRAKLSLID